MKQKLTGVGMGLITLALMGGCGSEESAAGVDPGGTHWKATTETEGGGGQASAGNDWDPGLGGAGASALTQTNSKPTATSSPGTGATSSGHTSESTGSTSGGSTGSGAGTGGGSTYTGGTGGFGGGTKPPPGECSQFGAIDCATCSECAQKRVCADATATCNADPACSALQACWSTCAPSDSMCSDACVLNSGAIAYSEALDENMCVYGECFFSCQDSGASSGVGSSSGSGSGWEWGGTGDSKGNPGSSTPPAVDCSQLGTVDCASCAQCAEKTACADASKICKTDPACSALQACWSTCAPNDSMCSDACILNNGAVAYSEAMNENMCVYYSQCFLSCN